MQLQVGDMVRVTEAWLKRLNSTNPASPLFRPFMYGLFFVVRLRGERCCEIRPTLGAPEFYFGFDKLELIHRKGDPNAKNQTTRP